MKTKLDINLFIVCTYAEYLADSGLPGETVDLLDDLRTK